MRKITHFASVVFVLFALLTISCSTKYIPNTVIEDTIENRMIIKVVEDYRVAMQERNIDRVMSLATMDYYDTGGTQEPEDDLNREGLRKFLEDTFKMMRTLELTIRVEKITMDEENENKAYADFRYLLRYQVALPAGDVWKASERFKRMVLVRANENAPWLIQSGM